jgi:hypothetical protein
LVVMIQVIFVFIIMRRRILLKIKKLAASLE